jgi:hypothetical protein
MQRGVEKKKDSTLSLSRVSSAASGSMHELKINLCRE